jgi:DNA-binding MarR family transcriptional regulator
MSCCEFANTDDEGLSPEIRSMKGVYLLYLKIEELVSTEELEDPLPQNARHMLLLLESPKRMGDLAKDMLLLPSTVTALDDKL